MDMAIVGRLFGPLQSLPLRPSSLLPQPWPWPRPKHRTTSAVAADAQNRRGREAPAASGAGREEMAEQTIPVGAPCACRCRGSATRHASPGIDGGASKGKDMLGSWSHHHVADPRAWSHHHVADVPAAYRHGHLLQGLGRREKVANATEIPREIKGVFGWPPLCATTTGCLVFLLKLSLYHIKYLDICME
jgi:hypothetical protein